MYTAQLPYTPPSSPPSSPSLCIDSSPFSSPGIDPISLDSSPTPMHLSHPFAGSAKANRIPPQYEKRPSTPPYESPTKKARHVYRPVERRPETPESSDFEVMLSTPVQTREQREDSIWDEASTNVFEHGHGAVTLANRDLTHIPTRFISDLEKFYVPPENVERINTSGIFGPSTSPTRAAPGGRLFTRVTTAPAGAANIFPQSRTFGVRTNTISEASSFGLPRENIQLFLASNRISRLPLELFALRRLTVLTMRSNLLTYIPPEIAQLTNLHTLNIANNRIRYLPAEMLNMTLNKLQVHPNPFLQPPPGSSPPRRTPRRTSTTENDQSRAEVLGCPVSSATHPLPRVIPLVELSLRALLASPGREECMLSLQYELPLYEHPSCPGEPSLPAGKQRFYRVIPPHLREILDACVPGSVYADSEEEAESLPVSVEVTGIGSCLSPRHGSRRAVFAQHAEERFTWDNTIAGVDIGGAVPMKWRGCEWGCLDFLTSKKEDASVEPAHDEDDLDMENVVQVVDFTSDVFGGDVFE